MGMRKVNTCKQNVQVTCSKGLFGKDKFNVTYNEVEINCDAAKELAEIKEFRRANVLLFCFPGAFDTKAQEHF